MVAWGGVVWFLKTLVARFNASEAHAEIERKAAQAEIAALRIDNHECEARHTQQAIAAARVEASLEAMKQAMLRCNQAGCPLQAEPPKRTTTRFQPRPRAA
jgi:hypothetical protein